MPDNKMEKKEATKRRVAAVYEAMATSDGAGVNLNRALGTPKIGYIDPFLMLDEFSSDDPDDYIAGFPPHPHRGFETVTYMIDGKMKHEDSTGETGILEAGGVQWMSAGRGVIHSEMPMQEEGLMRGFQLWINLPRANKMMKPVYQNISPAQIPVIDLGSGGFIKVIAGEAEGKKGPVKDVFVDPVYLDINLTAGQNYTYVLPEPLTEQTAFAYVFEGAVNFGDKTVEKGHLAHFTEGNTLEFSAPTGGRFILLAGKALNEPVFKGGPFVMNTRDEIVQAYRDFETGKFLENL